MQWTVKTCLLTLVILFLWREGEVTEACTCFPAHPQELFCRADVVIRATVGDREEIDVNDGPFGPRKIIKYNIEHSQLFKGPERIYDAFYTRLSSAACGVNPDPGDYVMMGHLDTNGRLQISLCGFLMAWDELTAMQKKGLHGLYSQNCDCTITPCFSIPCATNSDMECLWTDSLFQNQNGRKLSQAKYSVCIKTNDSSCRWYSRMKPLKLKVEENQEY